MRIEDVKAILSELDTSIVLTGEDEKKGEEELSPLKSLYPLTNDSTMEARYLKAAWFGTCFYLARQLGWPSIPLEPYGVGTVVGSEYGWRRFLMQASIPMLCRQVEPELRKLLDKQIHPFYIGRDND